MKNKDDIELTVGQIWMRQQGNVNAIIALNTLGHPAMENRSGNTVFCCYDPMRKHKYDRAMFNNTFHTLLGDQHGVDLEPFRKAAGMWDPPDNEVMLLAWISQIHRNMKS